MQRSPNSFFFMTMYIKTVHVFGHRRRNVSTMYKMEVFLVPKLNAFLENEPFGPYDHISQAVNQLMKLQKSKPEKANKLHRLLNNFVRTVGIDMDILLKWPVLMQMQMQMQMEGEWEEELDWGNPVLAPVADALRLLIGA